ncbi:MAG: fibronectin type III domain-containing protein [Candidatus Binatia bacterium]|nr:fibronectin type III domain-containing protein [Candidatus Binatia bacterium]
MKWRTVYRAAGGREADRCSRIACLVLLLLLAACGRKTAVRPPELVAPEPVRNLTLAVEDNAIQLRWERPQRYMDGSEMDDLGGFIVLRAVQGGGEAPAPFTQIAVVPVEDRDRFRQAKRFSYTDAQLTPGTLYRYRVQAFTLDGHYSRPSNTVELVWQGGS